MSDDDIENINIEEDPLQLAIQMLDDEYFKSHPDDDYYIRQAVEGELARAGYPDYVGLMLVYVISEGTRVRKPVANTESAIEFMVRYEAHQDEA